jgi:hypothetical protein
VLRWLRLGVWYLLRAMSPNRRSQLQRERFLQLTVFRSPRAWSEPLLRRRRPHPGQYPLLLVPYQGMRRVPGCSMSASTQPSLPSRQSL